MTPSDVMHIARRFIGEHERAGPDDNPLIVWMLRRVAPWADHDEVAWCSAYVNAICWICGIPESGSAAARSWLSVGITADLDGADLARHVYAVVVKQQDGDPGPDVRDARGHVGFLAGWTADTVRLCGGNQRDQVCEEDFPRSRVLGVRQLTLDQPEEP
jgi:uncharacterized protein (TIGR02594 family)